MRYGQIRQYDIANGPGIRTSIFVTGCTHACPGCFNEEYFDFDAGHLWTEETTEELISYLDQKQVAGLTVLGGEPFQNTKDLIPILKEVKERIGKPIWIYSGYTIEKLVESENRKKLLDLCDVLVDGLFQEDLADPSLKFRGSSNQRIIDLDRSRKDKKLVSYYPEGQLELDGLKTRENL